MGLTPEQLQALPDHDLDILIRAKEDPKSLSDIELDRAMTITETGKTPTERTPREREAAKAASERAGFQRTIREFGPTNTPSDADRAAVLRQSFIEPSAGPTSPRTAGQSLKEIVSERADTSTAKNRLAALGESVKAGFPITTLTRLGEGFQAGLAGGNEKDTTMSRVSRALLGEEDISGTEAGEGLKRRTGIDLTGAPEFLQEMLIQPDTIFEVGIGIKTLSSLLKTPAKAIAKTPGKIKGVPVTKLTGKALRQAKKVEAETKQFKRALDAEVKSAKPTAVRVAERERKVNLLAAEKLKEKEAKIKSFKGPHKSRTIAKRMEEFQKKRRSLLQKAKQEARDEIQLETGKLPKEQAKEVVTLQKQQADDVFNKSLDEIGAVNKDITEPKATLPIFTPEETNVQRHTLLLSGIGESVDTRLRKFGPKGIELADKIATVELRKDLRSGKAERIIGESLKHLTPNELDNLTDVLDVGLKPINVRVGKAADEVKKLFNEVGGEAEILVPGFSRRNKFFPHFFDKKNIQRLSSDKDWLSKEAAKVMKKKPGQFGTLEEAEEFVKESMTNMLYGNRRFTSLDFHRNFDAPGWVRDPKIVLPKYFKQAYRRLEEIKVYGLADKQVRTLIDNIGETFGDTGKTFAKEAFEKVIQDYSQMSRLLQEGSSKIRAFQTITKLGLGQITNAGQTANTFIRTNARATFKGMRHFFTKEGKDFARDAGAFVDTITEELSAHNKWADKFLTGTGFSGVEFWNRGVAALSARAYMKQRFNILTAKGGKRVLQRLKEPLTNQSNAKAALEELGVNVEKALARGYLTRDEMLEGAFKVVKSTQFTTRAQDLPLYWSSPISKVFVQFKSFAFQHAKFMKNAVFGQAKLYIKTGGKQGSLAPLIRSGIASMTIGELVADTKSFVSSGGKNPFGTRDGFLSGKDETDFFSMERQLENFFQLGAFGLWSDMLFSARFGKQGVFGAVAGPTGSDVVNIATPIFGTAVDMAKSFVGAEIDLKNSSAKKGKTLLREVTRKVPVIGTPLKKRFLTKDKAKPKKRKRKRRGRSLRKKR